jgi:ligand-binding sensor domain-containing protein
MNIAKTPPLLTSDASIGLVMFGKGIAQLSAHDRDWTVRAEGPTITAFVRDDQGRYWLGTHEGVARLSVEDGKWQVIPIGLEGSIAALAIDPSGYLIAAVDGRGIFRARLP